MAQWLCRNDASSFFDDLQPYFYCAICGAGWETGAACIGLLARETCTFGRTTSPAGILLYYGAPAAMLAWIDGSIELRIGQRIGSAARKTITMLQIRTITMLQIRTITMLQGVQGVRVPHLLSSPGAVLEMVGIKSAMAQIGQCVKEPRRITANQASDSDDSSGSSGSTSSSPPLAPQCKPRNGWN